MKTDHIISTLKLFEGWAVELDRLGPIAEWVSRPYWLDGYNDLIVDPRSNK